jgi:Bacterial CdiA-CT RNAse A domain
MKSFAALALLALVSAPQTPAPSAAQRADQAAHRRDLSADESMGGHTLARHVGRTDAQLADRLRREHQISAASTYTDRAAAERAVGQALDSAGGKLKSWERRTGSRPNLVLHYQDRSGAAVGRSLFRGAHASVPCDRALVVLKWDDRGKRFFVLTSYPDCTK